MSLVLLIYVVLMACDMINL